MALRAAAACVVSCCTSWGQVAPVATAPSERAQLDATPWIEGWTSLRFRSRWTDDEDDHDAYSIVALDYGVARHAELTAHVMGRIAADVDGREEANSVFGSLEDRHDGAVTGELYHAWVDWAPKDGTLTLRAGRQIDARTPEFLHLDGITLRTRAAGARALELGLYGGVPVHLYESSSSGDLAFGTWAEARPWKGARARFDWMHLEDEARLGEFRDDLLGLDLWQSIAAWSAEARYTFLEQESRDLRLALQHVDAENGSVVRASYFELFETQREHALEFDPFSSALLEYFPYRQAGVSWSQPLGEHLDVDVAADLRRVRDEADVGEFNRDWERYRATATLREFGVRGLALSLIADRWNGDGRDASTWGADATFEPEERWRFSLGSDYALYKYDLFGASEHDDVRTYYLRTRCKPSAALSFDLAYEYEDADFDEYQYLRWGVTWRF